MSKGDLVWKWFVRIGLVVLVLLVLWFVWPTPWAYDGATIRRNRLTGRVELWYNGKWRTNPLGDAQRPDSRKRYRDGEGRRRAVAVSLPYGVLLCLSGRRPSGGGVLGTPSMASAGSPNPSLPAGAFAVS